MPPSARIHVRTRGMLCAAECPNRQLPGLAEVTAVRVWEISCRIASGQCLYLSRSSSLEALSSSLEAVLWPGGISSGTGAKKKTTTLGWVKKKYHAGLGKKKYGAALGQHSPELSRAPLSRGGVGRRQWGLFGARGGRGVGWILLGGGCLARSSRTLWPGREARERRVTAQLSVRVQN